VEPSTQFAVGSPLAGLAVMLPRIADCGVLDLKGDDVFSVTSGAKKDLTLSARSKLSALCVGALLRETQRT
jgi:hypothetical protein